MTDEPMVERLDRAPRTDSEKARETIDALRSQLREQRERADEWKAKARTAYADGMTAANALTQWDHDILNARLDAAERTVREQRDVIEAAQELVNVWDRQAGNTALVRTVNMVAPVHGIRQAIAALAPDTEREGTDG